MLTPVTFQVKKSDQVELVFRYVQVKQIITSPEIVLARIFKSITKLCKTKLIVRFLTILRNFIQLVRVIELMIITFHRCRCIQPQHPKFILQKGLDFLEMFLNVNCIYVRISFLE